MKSDELKQLMLENSLTAADVAKLLGVSTYAVYAWRSKARKMPRASSELLKIKLQG